MSVAELPDVTDDPADAVPRRLFLVWQDPSTRAFTPVGALEARADGTFAYRYLRAARQLRNFRPLASFPRFDRLYRSADLPPFFENRVMSRRRPDFADYVRALRLDVEGATPFEVLARTGGDRATDTFHVVAEPEVDPTGHTVTRFLASGIRHIPGARQRVAELSVGDALRLRRDPDNSWNDRALLIDVAAGVPVGYVPDWMLGFVGDLIEADPTHRVLVEQAASVDVPSHLQLLCRLEASLPKTYRPFSGDDFDYVDVIGEELPESD